MKAFQHKSNLKHTAVLLFGIMMSCATVKAQDVPCLPSSFGETESQSAWCGIVAYTLHIVAHGTNESPSNWYLIASPIGTVAATNVANLANVDNNAGFDLYRFNQGADMEWENWKQQNSDHYHFNLEPGIGYLYANAADVTLVFAGTPYSGNGEVTLQKTEGAELSGWNLVGNPFAVDAYIDRSFYRMNESGSEIMSNTSTGAIAPMEGVFVIAGEDGETLTFNTDAPGKGANLALNVTKGRSVIDRAIVNFGEGGTLPKFQLFENSTKVYIPQEGKDYAVVNAEAAGEMPVNFKADENGTYTLSFSNEEVTFSYLHLIDNMTGNDVDLLQNPSYTFTARTTDYESRFKLVFASKNEDGPSTGSGTFAFYSNGNWIIANEGEATLQVIDITGRILSSETVNGSVSKAIHAAPGVYVLRLINGNDVKVQKIVVR